MLDRSIEKEYPFLTSLSHRREIPSFSPLCMLLSYCFFVDVLIQVEEIPSVLHLLRKNFYHE